MRRSCHPLGRFSYELEGLLVVSAPRSADLELFRWNADVHLYDTLDDPHRIRVHRKYGRQGAHFARQEVESRPVARALDQAVLELAFAEHTAVVRAHVVDRAPGAVVAVAETETLVTCVDDLHLADRDLVLARDRDELAQARMPISAMLPMRGRSAFSTRWRTCSASSWLITRRKNPCTMSCCAWSRSNPRDIA